MTRVLLLVSLFHADIVTLHNGRRVEGTVTREDDRVVEIRGRHAEFAFQRGAVVSIGLLERKVETLLDEIARSRDGGRNYTARVVVPPR